MVTVRTDRGERSAQILSLTSTGEQEEARAAGTLRARRKGWWDWITDI